MKKSLIALAVLAASGAAMAQSSVTLYGIADIWLGSVKTEDGLGNDVSTTKLDSGGVNTSRWGLKGSEDLGGGLKANFLLEQGFKIDDGSATAGQAFSRYAFVGLSGGFGAVTFGKTGTAMDDVAGASNAMFDANFAPTNYVFESANFAWNPGNTVKYQAPDFGGFSGAVSYTMDEDVALSPAITSFNLTYGAGPLAAQLSYQVEDANLADDIEYIRLGGSYNFGMATLKAIYAETSNVGYAGGFDATDWQIGVDFPVSAALTVSASYAKSDDSNVGFEAEREGYGIAANYLLSKRTSIYGGYVTAKETQNGAGDAKISLFAVGLNHKF